jgi:hypothetical protein
LRTIDVRPHRGGWQVFEAPGVEPFYIGPNAKAFATDYAVGRLKFSPGEVRVLNPAGAVERVIPPNTDRCGAETAQTRTEGF